LNAETGEYVDLMKVGIVDPAKVARLALENAASISSILLTTESLVTDIPERETCPTSYAWRSWRYVLRYYW
ncbi:unnamed protein product, partial [marine sediment metagenome]